MTVRRRAPVLRLRTCGSSCLRCRRSGRQSSSMSRLLAGSTRELFSARSHPADDPISIWSSHSHVGNPGREFWKPLPFCLISSYCCSQGHLASREIRHGKVTAALQLDDRGATYLVPVESGPCLFLQTDQGGSGRRQSGSRRRVRKQCRQLGDPPYGHLQ